MTKGTKSEETRPFGLEPNLVPLLWQMCVDAGSKGRVFPDFPRPRDLAEKLREYLGVAGVIRPELFISDATRINLRWHDLRASTVSWMAVRGDTAEKIMQRVGHEDWDTMKKYLRTAEALAVGFGEVFPALPTGLLGAGVPLALSPFPANHSLLQRGGRDSKPIGNADPAVIIDSERVANDHSSDAISARSGQGDNGHWGQLLRLLSGPYREILRRGFALDADLATVPPGAIAELLRTAGR